ncbi:polysaccharide biosynthesis/export family protein [Silvibacterium sp.]|uniref:polysaccharide biosynthesis/export family protein n=1 Tax=Silvibacterium sp. TaxID=1964179 RepID=UPI0039E2E68D
MAITNKAAFALLGLAFLSASAIAQSDAQSASASQAAPAAASERVPLQNIPITSGDLLDVEVFNTPELSGKLRVDQQGAVVLPIGGTVKVDGMLPSQAAATIQERLVTSKIMLSPLVTVDIVDYSTDGVTVLGEVKAPGVYTLLGPRSLYDALAAAGGVTASEGSSITVTHAYDSTHPITVNVTTQDYSPEIKATVVLPGDTVVVNRAPLIYVVGDFVHSGAFYIQGGTKLTVLNVVSLAQGFNKTAAMGKAAIVRPLPDGTAQTIRFNLNKVLKNQIPAPVMQAGDVLVLPRSGWKDFGLTALPGATNAVVDAVAYSQID